MSACIVKSFVTDTHLNANDDIVDHRRYTMHYCRYHVISMRNGVNNNKGDGYGYIVALLMLLKIYTFSYLCYRMNNYS